MNFVLIRIGGLTLVCSLPVRCFKGWLSIERDDFYPRMLFLLTLNFAMGLRFCDFEPQPNGQAE